MPIKAISFDFWSTLFTEQPDGYTYYSDRRHELIAEAISRHGEFTIGDICRACSAEAEAHYICWTQEHRTPGTRRRVDSILRHLGVELEDARAEELSNAIAEGIMERPPILIEGAREVIESLSRKYPLGIISDTGFSPGRVLRRVLEQNGMLDAFQSLVFSDEAGRSKPHAEVFAITSQTLKSAPEETVHIGDLEPTDVTGAKNAKYKAIRFTGVTPMETGESTRADFVTDRLSDIPDLLLSL